MKEKLKNKKGITLIALVITIIILIILAGIVINVTIGKNGIFTKTKEGTRYRAKDILKHIAEVKASINEVKTSKAICFFMKKRDIFLKNFFL